jgi:hypothetical protein
MPLSGRVEVAQAMRYRRCWLLGVARVAPLWKDHPRCSPWPLWRTATDGRGGLDMWAQLMRWRLKPGKDTAGLREQLQAVEQPDSGLLRTISAPCDRQRGSFRARCRLRPAV